MVPNLSLKNHYMILLLLLNIFAKEISASVSVIRQTPKNATFLVNFFESNIEEARLMLVVKRKLKQYHSTRGTPFGHIAYQFCSNEDIGGMLYVLLQKVHKKKPCYI